MVFPASQKAFTDFDLDAGTTERVTQDFVAHDHFAHLSGHAVVVNSLSHWAASLETVTGSQANQQNSRLRDLYRWRQPANQVLVVALTYPEHLTVEVECRFLSADTLATTATTIPPTERFGGVFHEHYGAATTWTGGICWHRFHVGSNYNNPTHNYNMFSSNPDTILIHFKTD